MKRECLWDFRDPDAPLNWSWTVEYDNDNGVARDCRVVRFLECRVRTEPRYVNMSPHVTCEMPDGAERLVEMFNREYLRKGSAEYADLRERCQRDLDREPDEADAADFKNDVKRGA